MFEKPLLKRLPRTVRLCLYALLSALVCMLLTPLSALAGGGMFSADAYTEQSAERLIFAVNANQVTLYEQIQYTGSPQDFSWVLPVPSVPTISSASASLFQTLNNQTTPNFYAPASASCPPTASTSSTSVPNTTAQQVNIYSSGTVGPYSYDVLNSSDPKALTNWLSSHNYTIPAASQPQIQAYTTAHMYFLAMRLKGNAGVQNMTPVKITYTSPDQTVTIPLRMAAPETRARLGVLVWIFGKSRYSPSNYQLLQLDDRQLDADPNPTADYTTLVTQAVDQANGHGFVADYAQPTSKLNAQDDVDLQDLQQHYNYLTRLYTTMSASEINLDPTFAPATNLANINPTRALTLPKAICWPSVQKVGGLLLLSTVLCILIILLIRRRYRAS